MKALEYVAQNERETLNFLKSKYPFFHLSNVFFRDLQFGIQAMLAEQGKKVSSKVAERIARAFTEKLERAGVLVPVDVQSWVLHYPEFRKPSTAKAAAPVKQTAPVAVAEDAAARV